MSNELISHLARIRRDAGNPSYRTLARLTQLQGPLATMGSSTVAEKLTGKPPLDTGHVLVLVRAIADYAAQRHHPLPPEEIAPELWRARVKSTSRLGEPVEPLGSTETGTPASLHAASPMQNASEEGSEGPAASEKTWHLEPLKLAGMDDIVSWIEENEGTNYSIWMPRVLEALDLAKMTDLQFVMATGNRPPLECCELMHALGEGIGAKRVIAAMASRYSVDGIPKAIVAMRRYPVEWIREASSSFVDFVADGSMPGTWAASKQRRDIRAIHDALGRANLNDDASRLISQVAKSRAGAGLVNLALSFPRDAPWDDGNILLSHLCDAGGTYRIVSTIKVIRDADRLSDKTKTEMLEMITGSIPDKAQASVRKALEQAGIIGLLHTPGDEPPF